MYTSLHRKRAYYYLCPSSLDRVFHSLLSFQILPRKTLYLIHTYIAMISRVSLTLSLCLSVGARCGTNGLMQTHHESYPKVQFIRLVQKLTLWCITMHPNLSQLRILPLVYQYICNTRIYCIDPCMQFWLCFVIEFIGLPDIGARGWLFSGLITDLFSFIIENLS